MSEFFNRLESLYSLDNKKVVIIGEGKIGKIIANFFIDNQKKYVLEAFLVDDGYRKQKAYRNIDIYEMTEFISNKKVQNYIFLNTVTSKDNDEYREHLFNLGIQNILEINDADTALDIATKYWLNYFRDNGVETSGSHFVIGDFVFPNPFLETVPKDIQYAFVTDVGDLITPIWMGDYSNCDDGPYETDKVRVQQDNVVIDCGANIGIFTANAIARRCKKVYSIEPVLNESLIKCKEIFGERISLHVLGLSDYEGKADIYINPEACNDNSIYYIQNTLKEKRIINVMTLDNFVENEGIQEVNFIKFYIDDLECRMLLGAKKTIIKYMPNIAIFPYFQHDTNGFKERLSRILKSYNENYIIEYSWNKMFAYVK